MASSMNFMSDVTEAGLGAMMIQVKEGSSPQGSEVEIILQLLKKHFDRLIQPTRRLFQSMEKMCVSLFLQEYMTARLLNLMAMGLLVLIQVLMVTYILLSVSVKTHILSVWIMIYIQTLN